MSEEPWHSLTAEEVLRKLGASREGLDPAEVEARLEQYGPNALPEAERLSPIYTLLRQLRSPLIYILLIAAIISFTLGETTDAVVILGIVVFNALIGFVQEYKAERALEALKQLAAPTAKALRAGQEREIPTEQIVPGDVILIAAGDTVPADARILEAHRLRVDEASLTGESVPVDKRADPLPPETALADRDNMLYSGTAVVAGRGSAVVVATGLNTVTGRIALDVGTTRKPETHIQRKLADIGNMLGIVAILVAIVLTAIGLMRGFSIQTLFLLAVAVAVSFIPEGLPAIVSIVLAVGVQRMARRNAIIRKLPAVESLGSTTVICTDKTGTLTRNEMTVQVCCTAEASFRFTGEGYAPTGEILTDGNPANPDDYPDLRLLLTVGALCNDSSLIERDGQWSVKGDPTEGALIVAAAEAGMHKTAVDEQFPRVDEIPFDPETRYMATLNRPRDGQPILCVKGAPEEIVALCDEIRDHGENKPLSDERHSGLHETATSMAGQAYRVLAAAYREVDRGKSDIGHQDIRGLVFLGFFGMIDPPRPEAIEAVARAKQAGIRIMMVTGDNPVTAEAIARTVGVFDGGEVVIGQEIEQMSDEDLARRIQHVSVFARVEPQQKYRIVQALKKNGELVAMTGDGVNDAPALKLADVGVAMGITGTNVARESADMVLADDNFATIVAAVEEGRTIYANIRKVVQYLLATNTGELLTYMIAIAAGMPLPLLPVQILWVNLVTDGFATAPLAVEPKEGDILREPPRDPKEPVLTRKAIARIAVTAVVMAVITLGLFNFQLGHDGDVAKARTMAFAVLALLQLFNAFNARSPTRSVFRLGFHTNPYVLLGVSVSFALQVLVTQAAFLQPAFHTIGLSLAEWGLVIALSASILVVEEIRKALTPNLFYDPPSVSPRVGHCGAGRPGR